MAPHITTGGNVVKIITDVKESETMFGATQRIAFSRATGGEELDKCHGLSRKIGLILNAPTGASVATRCWVAAIKYGTEAKFD